MISSRSVKLMRRVKTLLHTAWKKRQEARDSSLGSSQSTRPWSAEEAELRMSLRAVTVRIARLTSAHHAIATAAKTLAIKFSRTHSLRLLQGRGCSVIHHPICIIKIILTNIWRLKDWWDESKWSSSSLKVARVIQKTLSHPKVSSSKRKSKFELAITRSVTRYSSS